MSKPKPPGAGGRPSLVLDVCLSIGQSVGLSGSLAVGQLDVQEDDVHTLLGAVTLSFCFHFLNSASLKDL